MNNTVRQFVLMQDISEIHVIDYGRFPSTHCYVEMNELSRNEFLFEGQWLFDTKQIAGDCYWCMSDVA
jgi:hypothetical protein